MEVYHGNSVSNGIAIGRSVIFQDSATDVVLTKVTDPTQEIVRFRKAQEQAAENQEVFYESTLQKATAEEAELFHVHAMLIRDPDFSDEIEQMIEREHVSAAYAVQTASRAFSEMFAAMSDEYMRARSGDFLDIGKQIIDLLLGTQSKGFHIIEPSILFADDLLPSQAVQLDLNAVLAFVTRKGSYVSHTAILARNMGIPAIVGVLFPENFSDTTVIVDSENGDVIFDPTEEVLQDYEERLQKQTRDRLQLTEYLDKPTVTPAGQKIELCANIGHPEDADDARVNGAEGVGLFRSEFLYMDCKDFPDEETQYNAYRLALEKMDGKRVIIRTLDIGADKQVSYFQFPKEDNPALGCRAIRLCLKRKDIFLTQMRALLRASVHGRLGIMLPMVSSIDEIRQAKEIYQQARQQLMNEGYSIAPQIEFGIMIETPAAAVISRDLAKEVDFFSVGTNDLTQYTLAVDRMNSDVQHIYDPAHPAVLNLIRMAAQSAHEVGIWIGICGESAADRNLLPFYLEIGIDELSVSPKSILRLRKDICSYCAEI